MAGIYRRRDRLIASCIEPHLDQRVEGELIQTLARSLRRCLPSQVTYDTVFESIRYLAGRALTRKEGTELAWRLAGNLPALKAGRPAGPWSTQQEKEWVPLQILAAAPYRNTRNKLGYNFEFRALAGSPCPMKLRAFWTKDLTRALASRLGFSRWRDGRYPFHHSSEFVGLRLLGELEPARSQYVPTFYEVAVPDSFVKWNRDNVLRIRCRVDDCPRGYTGACRHCAVGYVECPAATHRLNYRQVFCNKCGELKWFDLDLADDRCIDCQYKQLLKKHDV